MRGQIAHLIHASFTTASRICSPPWRITHPELRTAPSMSMRAPPSMGGSRRCRAHDRLTRVSWDNATIKSTVQNAIEPFDQGGGRFIVSGEDTGSSRVGDRLCNDAQRTLHEHDQGRRLVHSGGEVRISWEDRWRSSAPNGPNRAAVAPSRPAGASETRMMTSLAQQLKGKSIWIYEPSGFVYTWMCLSKAW